MFNKIKKGFTLVELVVVITIMMVLTTVGYINYSGSLLDSRNSARISDMGNIKISLGNHKLKNGTLPVPGNYFSITNSGTVIKQGFLNESVETLEIKQKPKDPLVKDKYYTYSTTSNGLFYQIAMSLEDLKASENIDKMKAFVDGDYQTSSFSLAPTIVFATNSTGTIQSLSGTFIINKGTYNLPYGIKGDIINGGKNLSIITTQAGVNIPKFCGFYSCTEIYENGRSIGDGDYCLLDENQNQIITNCYMSSIGKQWKDIAGTNCDKQDIVIGNQVWAGCNSVLGATALNYSSGVCYDYIGNILSGNTNCYGNTTKENRNGVSNTAIGYNLTNSGVSNNIYGALYTWNNLSTQCKNPTQTGTGFSNNIETTIDCPCPIGWHVPTDSELTTLTTYLGGNLSIIGWNTNNQNSIRNKLGLGLAGGYNGSLFGGRGYDVGYWTSTEYNSTNSLRRYLSRSSPSISVDNISKTNGQSVRCIRDNYHK